MKKQKIIRKSKVSWVLTPTKIVAFDKIQATVYHAYENPNKRPLEEMRKAVALSNENELNSWVDVIGLAIGKGLKGYGTKVRPEWFSES